MDKETKERKEAIYVMEKKYVDERDALEKISKAKTNEIAAKDEKYRTLVLYIIQELEKREISIDDESFDQKVDEIIRTMLRHRSMVRYSKDSVLDIRNAIKRNLNRKKNMEGPSIGE